MSSAWSAFAGAVAVSARCLCKAPSVTGPSFAPTPPPARTPCATPAPPPHLLLVDQAGDPDLSDITCLSVHRARPLFRVRPGLRLRRELQGAPRTQTKVTSSKTGEPSMDHRSPPTYARPTRPHALQRTRS